MKVKKVLSKIGILASLLLALTVSSVDVSAKNLNGRFTTNGTITVTDGGIYKVTLAGAQGEGYGTYSGGKGSLVTFYTRLRPNDKVAMEIGTVGGGGKGTITNGGGRTVIKVNNAEIAVAGGGGGATKGRNGGDAGVTGSGNHNSTAGQGSNSVNTAGGGSGKKSGTFGHYHHHFDTDGNVMQSNIMYIKSDISPGGCYINKAGHTHDMTGICPKTPVYGHIHDGGCGSSTETVYYSNGCAHCNSMDGTEYNEGGACHGHEVTHTWHSNNTGIIGYNYACGSYINTWKCTETVEDKQSIGGSNYVNTGYRARLVTNDSYKNGTNGNTGDGYILIEKSPTIQLDLNLPNTNHTTTLPADLQVVYKSTGIDTSYPSPYLSGYVFLGWYNQRTGGTQILPSTEFNSDTTVYAHWEPADITINLVTNSAGATVDPVQVVAKYDSILDLPVPQHSLGSKFTGWYLGERDSNYVLTAKSRLTTGDKLQYTPYSNTITLIATWTEPTYKIKFDANGGTVNTTEITVTNQQSVGTLPRASRNEYMFGGWYTNRDGTGTLLADNAPAQFGKETTLYAHWIKRVPGEYPYTGYEETYTVENTGYYKLEAWGAQGGSYGSNQGGLGGYTRGVVYLSAGDVVSINVGGSGVPFNGAGMIVAGGYGNNGGGATDFRLGGNSIDNRVIIAGGGGGASSWQAGTAGGATNSGNNSTYAGGSNRTGGGSGYKGGTAGDWKLHSHNQSTCFKWVSDSHSWSGPVGPFDPDTGGNTYSWYCGKCGSTVRLDHMPDTDNCGNSYKVKVCAYEDGELEANSSAKGGSNYVNPDYLLKINEAGIRSGHGFAKITPMYTVVLDLNKPSTTNNFEVNATNNPDLVDTDTLIPDVLLVEDTMTYGTHEELPTPTLKGWKFIGWFKTPQLNNSPQITNDTVVQIQNKTKLLNNHSIYAHWQEEVYYIKYYKNNTTKNYYNDTITADSVNAVFDTKLNGANKTNNSSYRYDASEDCYIQTVKYDHAINVLPNFYSKTGYYFDGWTNDADTSTKGTPTTTGGTGTGKKLDSAKYYKESTSLRQHKNGEQFLENYGNFNYIRNEKALTLGTETVPDWSYGSDTVVLYATWEPIKYSLRYNGTNNWNTNSAFSNGTYTKQPSYLQKVTMANGSTGTTIRYDQIFNLEANLFKREAPYMIKSPDGLDVELKTGYQHTGWGFGLSDMKYSSTSGKTWDLLAVNINHNPDQGLITKANSAVAKDDILGRDYVHNQTNVINVISEDGIDAIEKYILDWSNSRTDSNRKDKTELDNKIIESNLHSIWRRNANDNHINNGSGGGLPDGPNCPTDSCGCPPSSDPNKPCECPSDVCPDSDDDGTCDCHDPEPSNPLVPDGTQGKDDCPGDNCNCPENPDGTCDCPSDDCDDTDNDGTCDCHDQKPLDPNYPDDHRPDVNCPDGCPCPDDGNGNCTCPSDVCPDRDNDGTCDCHDREPDNPNVPDDGKPDTDCPDGCGCPDDGTGNCTCPSDSCPDKDKDGTCDCHDPKPSDPNVPGIVLPDNNCPGNNCDCPDNGKGNCTCPSDKCRDTDDDGTCDCHDPEPNNPKVPDDGKPDFDCPNGACDCPDDNNDGECECPSDDCLDDDDDGTCNCHDPEPNNPKVPDNKYPDNPCPDGNCNCPEDENGDCDCPSNECDDSDKDGICDCHDPEPNHPSGTCPDDCNCPEDENGDCNCPDDDCDDDDKDGICNCHDPEPNHPSGACPDDCNCPENPDGTCDCPSDECEDDDKDGICNCHDPEPNHPSGVCPDDCGCPENNDGTCNCPSDECDDDDKDGICNCHDPEPNHPDGTCPDGCTCPEDEDGNCECPSDECDDTDDDGICDCHDPDPNKPDGKCPEGCNCPEDENGDCDCPSDECDDKDKDGICDCHDPEISDDKIGSDCPDNCPCPEKSNGDCDCPSSSCPDSDNDGICNCHDANPVVPDTDISHDDCPDTGCGCTPGTDPQNPNKNCLCPSDSCPDTDGNKICDCHEPENGGGDGGDGGEITGGDPTDPNDNNFGITITFDLNGGYIISETGAIVKNPIVLKQELFNDYYYEFDIIGNDNVDLLENLEVLDAYGNSSNTATPENNYNSDTGINYTFRKSDGEGGKYRLSGWSIEKGAVYPDFKITIDGIRDNNFDAFDFVKNNDTIKICNDTTLYAVWEPVLQLNVNLNRTLGGSVKTGTLTAVSNVTDLPKLALNPGEEVKYQVIYKGENIGTVVPKGETGKRIVPVDIEVTFDKLITGIYAPKWYRIHDNFNQITPDDTDSIKEIMLQKYTNLDRKLLSRRDGMITRKFNLPLYLGTLRAEQEGYSSFKAGGYTMTVTASRYSSFYKGEEIVTAELLLVTDGSNNNNGGGGGGGTDPTPPGTDPTPPGTNPDPNPGGGGNGDGGGEGGGNSSIANEIKTSITLD